MKLLTAADNGTGSAVQKGQWGNREVDQLTTIYIYGTFGGATVTVEISHDGTNWFNTGIAATAKGVFNLEFRAQYMRAIVAGGTGSAIDVLAL